MMFRVCDVGLAEECEASGKRVTAFPPGLPKLAEEFVFTVFTPAGVAHEEAKLVLKIEIV